MSQYLRFVLQRSNVPDPARITIKRPMHDWAIHQLADEFASAFPSAEIRVGEIDSAAGSDLYVLSYSGPFDSRDRTAWPEYRRLRQLRNAWVMLYGLDYRRIVLLRAPQAFRYVFARSMFTWLAEWKRIPRGLVRRVLRIRRP